MRYTLPSQTEPLRPRGPQLFIDWRYVSEGEVLWEASGKNLSIWDVPPAGMLPRSTTPYGVRLEAQRAENLGPLFTSDQPWEQFYMMYVSTVLYDAGKYRMWYVVVPADYRVPPDYRPSNISWDYGYGWMLCYAESEDGFTWNKPNLGLAMYQGQDTNFVYGRELSPNGFSSGSVFKDPHAPASERFKLLYRAEIKSKDRAQLLASLHSRFGDDMDPVALGEHTALGSGRSNDNENRTNTKIGITAGAVSPDGIHWTALRDPLMIYHSNNLNNAHWDENLGRYVGYFRMERSGRRSVGRSATADFTLWRTPEPILEVPLDWRPSDDIYHCPVMIYPESRDTYLMFATVYHRHTDSRDVHLASSVDGLSWRFVPGDHTIARGEFASWCGGDVHAGYGLVPLPGDRVGVPIVGYHLPHKHPRWVGRPVGSPGWAVWKKGRLGALVADDVGEFSTHKIIFDSRELSLNFMTTHVGAILVEMRDDKGHPIPGFTFSDADPLAGDSLDRRVSWRGDSNISAYAGSPVSFGVRLASAHLFAFEFVTSL